MRRLLFGYFLSQFSAGTVVLGTSIWIAANWLDSPAGKLAIVVLTVSFLMVYFWQRGVFRGLVDKLSPQELPDERNIKDLWPVGIAVVVGSFLCRRFVLDLAFHGADVETLLQDDRYGFLISLVASSAYMVPLAFFSVITLAFDANRLRLQGKR
jgi:hypothetical protein